MPRRDDLAGKVVVITGAAQGIGAATARALVEAGASVSLIDVDGPRLEALRGELGDRAEASVADITDMAALDSAVRAAVDRFGGIDAVVANAAIEVLGWTAEMDPADFRRVIDVNLVGTWNTVRTTLPAVIDRRGYYLIVASLAAVTNGPMNAAYNASKAGVVAMARTVRLELRPRGVEVGIAYLTYTDTETGRRAVEDPRMAEILRRVPGGKLRPIPVAAVARRFVRAIARRERRLLFDRSSRLAVTMPELAQAILERLMRRSPSSRTRR